MKAVDRQCGKQLYEDCSLLDTAVSPLPTQVS